MWTQEQTSRRLVGKQEVNSWRKMKQLLRARFLPPDYAQILYRQYQSCQQENRTVNEYTEEFYRLEARINLPESEEQPVAKYVDGLRLGIRDLLRLRDIYSVIEAVNMANKVESQFKLGSRRQANYRSPFNNKTSQEVRPDKGKQHAVNPPPNKAESEILWKGEHSRSTVNERNSGNPYAKPSLDICYRMQPTRSSLQ